MAAGLQVSYYVIAEHPLQVGSYHALMAIKDEEKKQKLQEHFVKAHLLGNELTDDEDMLGLGEKN